MDYTIENGEFYKVNESYGRLEIGQILTSLNEVIFITKEEYELNTGDTIILKTNEEIDELRRIEYIKCVDYLVSRYNRHILLNSATPEKLQEIKDLIASKTDSIKNIYKYN